MWAISNPVVGVESEMEMSRIAEILKYILRIHFHGRGIQSKVVSTTPSVNHHSKKIPEEIYNSSTQELIQFIRAGVFYYFPHFFFPPMTTQFYAFSALQHQTSIYACFTKK